MAAKYDLLFTNIQTMLKKIKFKFSCVVGCTLQISRDFVEECFSK